MQIAAWAGSAIAGAPHGAREQVIGDLSERAGLRPQTLRTYLLAYRFAAGQAKDVQERLGRMPAIAVETIARWYRSDPEAALQATLDYARGLYTIRKLRSAELASRRPGRVLAGREREREYRRSLLAPGRRVEAIWCSRACLFTANAVRWPALDFHPDQTLFPSATNVTGKADLFATISPWSGHRAPQYCCAVMIVGPYARADHYYQRAMDWCLRAIGLAHFHDMAALLLPPQADCDEYIAILQSAPELARRLLLLRDCGHRGDAEWRRYRAKPW